MSEVFDISSFGELEIGGGSFYLVPAGKYRAQVDQVEWTESKRSGRPMLVTTGIITEVISSSERDAEEAVGKSVTFYTVMTYTDKKTGNFQKFLVDDLGMPTNVVALLGNGVCPPQGAAALRHLIEAA